MREIKPKYHAQLRSHDPENGSIGDCYRTCVANWLGLHPSEVPAPNSLEDNTRELVKAWLLERDMNLFWVAFDSSWVDGEPWVHWVEREKNLNQFYILSGAATEKGTPHSCLYMNGELVHDPSGGGGLKHPMEVDGEYYWYLDVITHANPELLEVE